MSQDFRPVIKEMLAEKDAEIERLLLKHAKEQNVLLTSLEAAAAEIERLKAELKKRPGTRYCELQDEAYTEAMDEIKRKDAELERLKQLNLMTDEQVVMDLKAEIERLKAILDNEHAEMRIKNVLITELAEWCSHDPESITDHGRALLQRAREATR